MYYSVEALKEEIRVALDQNRDDGTLLSGAGDVDTLALEKIILSKIEDAARIVESNAARRLLTDGYWHFDSSKVFWNGDGTTGKVNLPADFMRLVVFKMSDWDYAVTEPIMSDDPAYARQHSRYGGVRGNPQRPVAALVERPPGFALEFFSCRTNEATIELATYLRYPKVETYESPEGDDDEAEFEEGELIISICENLKSAVVYYAAYMTALDTGETALAESMLAHAEQLMK